MRAGACSATPILMPLSVRRAWGTCGRLCVQSSRPLETGGKAAARRNERAAAPALSPAALADSEAEVRARAAEAELLVMLDLEEAEAGTRGGSGSVKGKAKGQQGKR